jgi:uncharacterized membrane protein HdeD (DUF308 family)
MTDTVGSPLVGDDRLLARNWWALALRGVLGIVVGLIALFLPDVTLAALVLLFAAYMLVDGVFAMVAGFRAAGRQERSWPLFLEGVAGILAGIVAIVWPAITLLAPVYLVGAWAIVSGVLLIAGAFRPEARREWLLALGGVISVIWGVLIMIAPVAGALALAWLFGAYTLAFGIVLLIVAFSLRRRQRAFEPARRAAATRSLEAEAAPPTGHGPGPSRR